MKIKSAAQQLAGQAADRHRQQFSMQEAASGTATGNKHISHIHRTPVTVQMGSTGREAGRAMKKDEQSDKETRGNQTRKGMK